jgi:hypothetical protein
MLDYRVIYSCQSEANPTLESISVMPPQIE